MQFKKGHIPRNKSKCLSQETRYKISIAKKRYHAHGGKNWNEGKHLSEEHKHKLSQSQKRVSEHKSQSLLKYYQGHDAWNKGRSWPKEVRERTY